MIYIVPPILPIALSSIERIKFAHSFYRDVKILKVQDKPKIPLKVFNLS